MRILAFESSCDETSAAIVEITDGKFKALSNIVASQIPIHALYGGVVPEIAGRAHIEAITNITYQAFDEAGVSMDDIDAVAVTYAPGLIGALLIAVNFAKSLALANSKPLIAVNHIHGHICAAKLKNEGLEPPFIALVASGGHTSLIHVKSFTEFETIGRTRDDAIGEAFDKTARVMGLSYPGGAEMDRLAQSGSANIPFPSAAINDLSLDFSFSGIKTAVINYVHNAEQKGAEFSKEDVAASFTAAAVKSVIKKLEMIFSDEKYPKKFVLSGGVAANSHLRKGITDFCEKNSVEFFLPEKNLCGDNAAMIAVAGYYQFMAGNLANEALNAEPSL